MGDHVAPWRFRRRVTGQVRETPSVRWMPVTRVLASTADVLTLADTIARRRETGQGTFDEWWEGTHRVVTGPSPEHGEIAVLVGAWLAEFAQRAGLRTAAPVNIGTDGVDARVPDLAVYRPDTPRTSPAFLATAVLVVEILSPKEPAGEKLEFYASAGVEEYLEVDLPRQTLRLLVRSDTGWVPADRSPALGFEVTDVGLVAGQVRYVVDWPEP